MATVRPAHNERVVLAGSSQSTHRLPLHLDLINFRFGLQVPFLDVLFVSPLCVKINTVDYMEGKGKSVNLHNNCQLNAAQFGFSFWIHVMTKCLPLSLIHRCFIC